MKKLSSLLISFLIIFSVFSGICVSASSTLNGNVKIFDPKSTESTALINSAQPGDVFVIPDGEYENVVISLKGNGTSDNPITLKSENPGKVIFTGESIIDILGKHIIISGIRFQDCVSIDKQYLIYFRVGSADCQIKDCAFINCNPSVISPDTKLDVVYIRGERHRVTNCYFNKKRSIGRMVHIENAPATNGHVPGYHIVEKCYFGNFESYKTLDEFNDKGYVNGFEALKIGSSDNSIYPSYSTVTGCFFENCNGEDELITTKSSNNVFSYNTFYNSSGALHLRCGNNSIVKGNVFINDIDKIDVKLLRSSGIRIYGENHTIVDNYFYNQPENTGAIFIDSGTPNAAPDEYAQVKNINVSNNTLVEVDSGIVLGMYYKTTGGVERKLQPDGKMENNIVVGYKGGLPLIYNGDTETDKHTLVLKNNYAYGKDLVYNGELPSGIINQQFNFKLKDGFIAASNGCGANIAEIKKAPLNPSAVAPQWVKDQLYGTNEFSFVPTQNDIFNNADAKINNLIPFSASITSLSDDADVKMYINGIQSEEESAVITNNPDIKFTASVRNHKKASWYINGIKLSPLNASDYNITMESEDAKEIYIKDPVNNYNITVEAIDKGGVPELLDYGFSYIKGNADDEPLIVKTPDGKSVEVTGNYLLVFTKIPTPKGINIKEYGVKISKDRYTFKGKYKALGKINENGAYGILFYNMTPSSTYYIKAYADYVDGNGETISVPGMLHSFEIK